MQPLLEKERQHLIDLHDALDKCISKGESVNEVYKYLSAFVAFAEEYFMNEEVIMKADENSEIINHKKEHADFLEQLFILKRKLGQGHTPFGRDYMRLLRNSLEVHLFGAGNRQEEFLYQVNATGNKMAVKV